MNPGRRWHWRSVSFGLAVLQLGLPSHARNREGHEQSRASERTISQVVVGGRGTLSRPRNLAGARERRPALSDEEGGSAQAGFALLSSKALRFKHDRRPASEVSGLQLRRFEDIFDTLDHDKPESDAEALMEARLTTEYARALRQRGEVCIPHVVGGEEIAQDQSFQAQVVQGRFAAASKGIIFAGLVRDIGTSGAQLFATLRSVGKTFAHYHIIVLENNSNDHWTRHGLQQECRSKDTWCFLLDMREMAESAQDQGAPSRVKHLTHLRQSLLEEVRKLSTSSEKSWDFVLMFDGDVFDSGSTGFHPTLIDALLGFRQEPLPKAVGDGPIDIVCANQVANWPKPGRYRDTFALKTLSWNETQRQPEDPDLYFKGNTLLPVKSCFSGLALYSMAAINTDCGYTYQGEEVCEHITFNRCLDEKGHGRAAIYAPLVVHTNDQGVPRDHCQTLPERTSAEAPDLAAVLIENAGAAAASGMPGMVMTASASASLGWNELLEKIWQGPALASRRVSFIQRGHTRTVSRTHANRTHAKRKTSSKRHMFKATKHSNSAAPSRAQTARKKEKTLPTGAHTYMRRH